MWKFRPQRMSGYEPKSDHGRMLQDHKVIKKRRKRRKIANATKRKQR